MKVNDLTEENARELVPGLYALFNEQGSLIDTLYCGMSSFFDDDIYFGRLTLDVFKTTFSSHEIFPVEQVKKPSEEN